MSSEPTSGQFGELCDDKYYCSVLEEGPQECPVGYYQPNEGQGSCIACPAGYLCTDLGYSTSVAVPPLRPVECPGGKYCPAQSQTENNQEKPCDPGYYSAITGAGSVEDCIECPVGKYRAGGLDQPDGDCDAGYFCPKRQSTATFTDTYEFGSSEGGRCPAGHYCEIGTLSPTPCPVGTYSNTAQNSDPATDCKPCLGGYYCDEVGLTEVIIKARNKVCDAGYFCVQGQVEPAPTYQKDPDDVRLVADYDGDNADLKPVMFGHICQPGNYCP